MAAGVLGYAKASRRAGLPTELVFYPRSGHGLTIPTLQRESAERNLDWFLFWLRNEIDSDPRKREQYQRWSESHMLSALGRAPIDAERADKSQQPSGQP